MIKLTAKQILKKIEKEKKKLKEKGVKKIGLFGSYARGEQKKNSDIDILIEFEVIDFDKYVFVLNLLEKIFKKKVDLVIEEDIKPELEYVKEEAEYVKV